MDNNENSMVGRDAPEPERSWRAGKTLLARQAHRSENLPTFAVGSVNETTEYFCHCCGVELTPENSREVSTEYSQTGISHLCIDCEEKYFEKLAEAEGRSLALFHCCAAFNVPCKPLVLEDTDFRTCKEPWILYVDRLAETGQDRTTDKVLTFFDGETNILRIFGERFTERDFAKYIQYERDRIKRLPGTPEQRAKWGEQEGYTTKTYNELDRLYEARASSYAGQTITPQMRLTLVRVAKWDYDIDRCVAEGRITEAKGLQSMVETALSSEQMRKKDEKPIENFRFDSQIVALQKMGLYEQGKFLNVEDTIKVIQENFLCRKKYPYSLDVADQIVLDIYNTMRANADQMTEIELPENLKQEDINGEFEPQETEAEIERRQYAGLIKQDKRKARAGGSADKGKKDGDDK